MLKKIVYFFGGLLLLLLIAAITIPLLFKGRIETLVKNEINNQLNATVEFSSFGMSFFRHFPSFSCSLHDLSIVGLEEFKGDTLASFHSFDVGVNFWSIVSGSGVTIRTIVIDQPRIHVMVLENGKANYDIAIADTTASAGEEPSSFELKLKNYEIRDGWISYDDKSTNFKVLLDNLNHQGSGDFTQDLFVLNTETEIQGTSLWHEGIRYLSETATGITADLEMDMQGSKYTFRQNEIRLNELTFGIDGWLAMPGENMDMDFKMNASENEFRHFLSLIPGIYREGFNELETDGKLALAAYAKGTYNEKQIPGFGIEVKVTDGMFRYPALPAGVNNVQVDLEVGNPDGNPDHTVVNLSRFHAELGDDPFDARLVVKTPVSDPDIDMRTTRIDGRPEIVRRHVHYKTTGLRHIIHMQKFPPWPATAPNRHRLGIVQFGLLKLTQQGRHHMAVLQMIIIPRAIKIGRHHAAKISAVLAIIGFA